MNKNKRYFSQIILSITVLLVVLGCQRQENDPILPSDQEYIKVAEPTLKKIIKDYPVTEEEKEATNFKMSVREKSVWVTVDGREELLSEEARRGGKYIMVYSTPIGQCYRYSAEIYVTHQLNNAILTYSSYPFSTTLQYGEVMKDSQCKINN